MNPEKQRIAMAEACGWSPSDNGRFHLLQNGKSLTKLPDYLNDLNAMHEAEKMLKDKHLLYTNSYLPEVYKSHFMDDIVCATASQRVEAFLRTIGKWKKRL